VTSAPASPFKGLSPFEDSELDALLFFGREREREIVTANLIASRLTVLYGPSGVGKSSLLRAGVARSLRELPEEPLVLVFSSWSDDPNAALAEAVRDAAGLRTNGSARDAIVAAQSERDVYLVLDQAEEYFLYHADDAGPRSFAEALPSLLGTPLRVNVLVSLREDSLAKLDRFTGRIPGLFANTLRLDRLDRASARAAILRPIERYAALAGTAVVVEPALVEAVLDEVGTGQIDLSLGGLGTVDGEAIGSRIEAPYLQLVMQRIWEEEQAAGSNVLRVQTLASLGGAQRIVEEHLDGAMAELTTEQKAVAARLFKHLVTPSGTKIAHEVSDLADFGEASPGEVEALLATLAGRRIVRSVDEGEHPRYEIFHDVLAQPVLAWRTGYEAERELEDERARSRRKQRRLLAVIALGVLLLAAMAGVTAYALTQRSEAQEQAAIAERNAGEADRQRSRAEQNQAKANQQAAIAKQNAATAKQQAELAEQNEAEANQQAELAEQNEAEANQQAELAEQNEAEANQQAELAEQNEAEATQQAAIAERQRNLALLRARRVRANELSARAESLVPTAPLRSVRLALDASRLATSAQVEDTLRRSLTASRVRFVLPGGGGRVTDATFSSDGRFVLVVATQARVYRTRTGSLVRVLRSSGAVSAASFAPGGRTVVTAGLDGRARLWPVGGGPPRVLAGHERAVQDAVYSPDGRYVATAGADRVAILWSATTGARLASFAHEGPVFQIEVSADGTHVLTVSRIARTGRRVARLYDAATGELIRTLDQVGITTAIFSPDGRLVVTASADDTARVWNLQDPAPLAILRHPDGNVVSAAFSADGTRLVTSTEGSSAPVWVVGTWERDVALIGPLNPATSASFNPSRRFVVVSSRDRNAHIFNADSGLRLAILTGHAESVNVASFSADGRWLVTASDDGSARIWDPGVEDLLQTVGTTSDAAVRRVALHPNGRLAISAEANGTARIVDVLRRRQLATMRHEGAVNDASFSPGGRLALTAGDDGTARLWSVTGTPVRTLTHGGRVLRAVFSPDGALVATAGDDRLVRLWRTRDGSLRRVLTGHTGAVLDVAFSRDGALVASAGDNADRTARLWRVGGRPLHVLAHRGPVVRVAFSPDGTLLATASGDEMARLWRTATGKLERTLRGHTLFVRSVDFRRDGRRLVTASDDGDGRVWNVATGRTVHVLRGHFSAVQSATFSPDGRWVVTAGPRTAGLWDARTGEFFAPTGLTADPFLRGPLRGPVSSALFTRDSRRIVTASGDGTIRTYRCTACGTLDELVRLARARLGATERNLTAGERLRYLRA
jgi:WD40 repeat protein